MNIRRRLAASVPALIGVVHLEPSPGAPRAQKEPMARLLESARRDALALIGGGCDALIVENFGDVPFFPESVPPETVAAMALAVGAVMECAEGRSVGVNVLRNDARSALGLAAASGADFLRVNVHTGAAVTDQGVVAGKAAETLRERARLAPEALIFADVHVKHATPLGAESIADAARDAALRGLADALVVTGRATGSPPDRALVREVREAAAGAPVLVGSGLNPDNAHELLAHASGAIVGTWFKVDGVTSEPVDPARVRRMRELFDQIGAAGGA